MTRIRIVLSLGAALLFQLPASAQTPERLDRELRVYFDCPNTSCDEDFLIQQIEWVDFVRDRAVADVHVLVAEESTGGGGEQYTLRFIGRERFAGREHTLTHVVGGDATDDDERRALARTARIGLAPFAYSSAAASRLDVAFTAGTETASLDADSDPWRRWVFELGMDSWFEGEDSYSARELYGWLEASRVTEAWRTSISLDGQNGRNDFEIDDSTTVVSRRESYGVSSLLVRSVSDHWSVGGFAGWNRSTRGNYDASLRLAPAIEYSIFPYSESSSRLFTILYAIGPRYYDYVERTIFDRATESILHHFLVASYDATQPWGSIDLTGSVTHFLTQLDGDGWPEPQYSASVGGGLEVRLFRGLSVRLNGRTELVRNQIQLSGADLTEEEILTRQRELATDYRYWGSLGLSYRFGSIYSPVVNRRLDYLD